MTDAAPTNRHDTTDPEPGANGATGLLSFTAGGHTWTLDLNVLSVERVYQETGADLYQFAENPAEWLERLYGKAHDVYEIVAFLLAPDLDAKGVTGEEFGKLFKRDVIEQAREALIEALVDFFPNEKERRALRVVVDETRRAIERVRSEIAHRAESGELAAKLRDQTEALLADARSGGAKPSDSGASPA